MMYLVHSSPSGIVVGVWSAKLESAYVPSRPDLEEYAGVVMGSRKKVTSVRDWFISLTESTPDTAGVFRVIDSDLEPAALLATLRTKLVLRTP
jgi:hypothetical protein